MIIKQDSGRDATATSVAWWRANRNRIGAVVRAEVVDYNHNDYALRLHDQDSNELWIGGVGAGYSGAGASGLITILSEEGFGTEDFLQGVVWANSTFCLSLGEDIRQRKGLSQQSVAAIIKQTSGLGDPNHGLAFWRANRDRLAQIEWALVYPREQRVHGLCIRDKNDTQLWISGVWAGSNDDTAASLISILHEAGFGSPDMLSAVVYANTEFALGTYK